MKEFTAWFVPRIFAPMICSNDVPKIQIVANCPMIEKPQIREDREPLKKALKRDRGTLKNGLKQG